MSRFVVGVVILCLLSSCTVSPKKVTRYDRDCQIYTEKLVLDYDADRIVLGSCSDESCVAMFMARAFQVATETIVSGSIVIVGNTIYWLKRQGACIEQSTAPHPEE